MPLSHSAYAGAFLLLAACGPARPDAVFVSGPDGRDHATIGQASWYGQRFQGRSTASGEPFDDRDFTAAHRTLPFQTVVRVVDVNSRKSVVVRINDRGPFSQGRVIDLSRAAAQDLDMLQQGVIDVRLEVLQWGDGSGR